MKIIYAHPEAIKQMRVYLVAKMDGESKANIFLNPEALKNEKVLYAPFQVEGIYINIYSTWNPRTYR